MKTLKLPLLLNTITVVSLFALLGCVNRGSHTDIIAPGGDSGTGGKIVPPTDAPVDQEQPPMPDASPDDGEGGVVVVDNCDVDGGSTDAGDGGAFDAGPPSSCTATYNFESPSGCGLYGSMLGTSDNPAATAAFSSLRHSGMASCGRGSMAVDVDFAPPDRLGGEIIIPISRNGTASFVGKTLSISLLATADGGNARFYVYLIANGSFQPVLATQLTPVWQHFSIPLPLPDAGANSADSVMSISLEAIGYGVTYKGTIYIDELDVSNTALDAGANDSRPFDGPADTVARDGGASDVRDAPAGS